MKVKEPINEFLDYLYPNTSEIILGDTLSHLKKMDDDKFDLIITSPPYNIGKEYETKTSIEKYLALQKKVIQELVRVTNKDSWVLDPYAGVGSTAIASLKNYRNSIGIEKEKEYVKIANERKELKN